MPKRLTPRQERFVQEYLVDRIARRAAIRAGYSPASAQGIASDLLHRPKFVHVQVALREALREDAARHEELRERTLQELSRIAFADIADVLADDGSVLAIADIPEDARAAIAELRETEFLGQDGTPAKTRKVRFWSKCEALTQLAKVTGLAVDRVEHRGVIDVRTARADLARILEEMGDPEGCPAFSLVSVPALPASTESDPAST